MLPYTESLKSWFEFLPLCYLIGLLLVVFKLTLYLPITHESGGSELEL